MTIQNLIQIAKTIIALFTTKGLNPNFMVEKGLSTEYIAGKADTEQQQTHVVVESWKSVVTPTDTFGTDFSKRLITEMERRLAEMSAPAQVAVADDDPLGGAVVQARKEPKSTPTRQPATNGQQKQEWKEDVGEDLPEVEGMSFRDALSTIVLREAHKRGINRVERGALRRVLAKGMAAARKGYLKPTEQDLANWSASKAKELDNEFIVREALERRGKRVAAKGEEPGGDVIPFGTFLQIRDAVEAAKGDAEKVVEGILNLYGIGATHATASTDPLG